MILSADEKSGKIEEERIKFACRRGKVIEPKRKSAEEYGFLPKGFGKVRTLSKKNGKTELCLFPECETCGYGSTVKAVSLEKDGTWNWDCVIKGCTFSRKEGA